MSNDRGKNLSDAEAPRPAFDAGNSTVRATLDELAAAGLDRVVAGETITSAARLVAEILPDVVGSMRAVVRLASAATREARRSLPVLDLACTAGCDACCHLHVSVSALEALLVAAFLRDTLSAEELASVRARVDRAAKRVRGMNQGERVLARVACPLLHEGRCIAYPVRPLACAGASSTDAAICDRALAGEPVQLRVDAGLHGAMRAARIGVSTGLLARGLDARRYELANALSIALAHEDAVARFLSGERLFEAAATPGDASRDAIERVARAFTERDPVLG
jgi:hypothetical protein